MKRASSFFIGIGIIGVLGPFFGIGLRGADSAVVSLGMGGIALIIGLVLFVIGKDEKG